MGEYRANSDKMQWQAVLVVMGLMVNQTGGQCLPNGEWCYQDDECCAGECSHYWPPTTTPVFGSCGPVPDCQAENNWCKQDWDVACCPGLTCVTREDIPEGLTQWGMCTQLQNSIVGT